MSTDEWVSLLAALGLFTSTVWGVVQKAIESYINYKEDKIQREYDRRIMLMKTKDESERYKIETQVILMKVENERKSLLINNLNTDGHV
jgi:hypothetical protein